MLTILILTTFYNWFYPATPSWKLAKEKDAIRVFTRNVAGTPYKEIRAEVVIKSTPNELLQRLNDYRELESWRYKVSEMELLAGDPLGDHHLYFAIATPFPLAGRDFVLDTKVEALTDGGIRISFRAMPDYISARPPKVRMDKMEGYWKLEPLPGGSTKVTYQYLSDPSGIPAWIVNMFSVTAPYQALKRLRSAIET